MAVAMLPSSTMVVCARFLLESLRRALRALIRPPTLASMWLLASFRIVRTYSPAIIVRIR